MRDNVAFAELRLAAGQKDTRGLQLGQSAPLARFQIGPHQERQHRRFRGLQPEPPIPKCAPSPLAIPGLVGASIVDDPRVGMASSSGGRDFAVRVVEVGFAAIAKDVPARIQPDKCTVDHVVQCILVDKDRLIIFPFKEFFGGMNDASVAEPLEVHHHYPGVEIGLAVGEFDDLTQEFVPLPDIPAPLGGAKGGAPVSQKSKQAANGKSNRSVS